MELGSELNLGTRILIPLLAASALLRGADPLATGVTRKLDLIQSGQARPGSVIHFTPAELNAWVRAKAPAIVPDGFRAPHLVLGNGEATASAWIDFLKVRSASGVEIQLAGLQTDPRGKVCEGSRPASNRAHGQATVHLLRVEIGGLAVTGATLDFLVQNFLLPFYPDAEIDTPFELADMWTGSRLRRLRLGFISGADLRSGFLAHANAVRNANAVIGIAGQIEARDGSRQLFNPLDALA